MRKVIVISNIAPDGVLQAMGEPDEDTEVLRQLNHGFFDGCTLSQL